MVNWRSLLSKVVRKLRVARNAISFFPFPILCSFSAQLPRPDCVCITAHPPSSHPTTPHTNTCPPRSRPTSPQPNIDLPALATLYVESASRSLASIIKSAYTFSSSTAAANAIAAAPAPAPAPANATINDWAVCTAAATSSTPTTPLWTPT